MLKLVHYEAPAVVKWVECFLVITTSGSSQQVRSKNGLSITIAAWGNHTIFGFCLNSLNSVNTITGN